MELARAAVDTGLWFLAESEAGVVTVNRDPREKNAEGAFADVRDYLLCQRRFRHMGDGQIELVEAHRDATWARLDEVARG